MKEVELKLRLDPADRSKLEEHPTLRMHTIGSAHVRPLRTVYFDSSDHALRRVGLELRVRDDGGERTLGVKTAARAGAAGGVALERGEWESPLANTHLALSGLPEPVRSRIGDAAGGAALEPVFSVEVRRTVRRIKLEGGEVELSLDDGELRTGNRTEPLCEVEIELCSGRPGRLYELGLELLTRARLRPEVRGKAARGYALAAGEVPVPAKAPAFQHSPGAATHEVFTAIASSLLANVLQNQAAAYDGRDPEGVHQLRVGVRRLRSALGFFAPALPFGAARNLRDELGRLGRALGPARDLDVFLGETLPPILEACESANTRRALCEVFEARRAQAYAEVRHTLDGARYARLVLELGRWLANSGWRRQVLSPESARMYAPAIEFCSERLARRDRTVRRAAARPDRLTAEDRHALRVRLKKLRYAAESLGGLYAGAALRKYVRRLASLQDRIGRANDARVAARLLAEVAAEPAIRADDERVEAVAFARGWVSRDGASDAARLSRALARLRKAPRFWRHPRR